MSDRDKQIQNEAYRLWEEAGRPETNDQAYWFEAEKRISAGEQEPVPPLKKAKGKASEMPAVAKNAGNSGVAAKAVIAPEKSKPVKEPKLVKEPKPAKEAKPETKSKSAPSKGDVVEVGLAKKKPAANANAKAPKIEKAKKPKG